MQYTRTPFRQLASLYEAVLSAASSLKGIQQGHAAQTTAVMDRLEGANAALSASVQAVAQKIDTQSAHLLARLGAMEGMVRNGMLQSAAQSMDDLRSQLRTRTPGNPVIQGWSSYSQCDEDGVIRECLRRIGSVTPLSRTFIEIGCGNGLENNTHQLSLDGFAGCWLDGDSSNIDRIARALGALETPSLLVRQAFVTLETISGLVADFTAFLGTSEIDFFSLDTDGNDTHFVGKALQQIRPKLVCVEYNPTFRPPTRVEMPYDASHTWAGDDYFGASLQTWVELLSGYTLVGCNLSGANAFFVRDDLMSPFARYEVEALYQPPRYWLVSHGSGHPASMKWLRHALSRTRIDRLAAAQDAAVPQGSFAEGGQPTERGVKHPPAVLCCPRCLEPLEDKLKAMRCPACDETYAVAFGVPILVPGAVIERTEPPSDRFVTEMAVSLKAAEEQVKECFSLRVRMPDPGMQVEADQFANRMRASGHAISAEAVASVSAAQAVNVADDIALQLSPLIWPKIFTAGTRHGISVRVSNTGRCVLSSAATPALSIAYVWHGPGGEVVEGHRSPLLIDLPPGRTITVPVAVEVPANPGSYILKIAPLLEDVSWFMQYAISTTAKVELQAPALLWTQDLDGPTRSYEQDHQRGVDLLAKWIDRHVSGAEPDILEIGGNFSPTTTLLQRGRKWNLDVDAHGLMARNIVGAGGVRSIVGDGSNLPFADKSLDVIAMFAAFHHFPDPIGLLGHLARKVKPEGLVCLMCEPIGHVQKGYHEFIRELELGVNEQSFEIWEYLAMLESAGLAIVDARFDHGSAKIAARPQQA